jgi:hypothetical protein
MAAGRVADAPSINLAAASSLQTVAERCYIRRAMRWRQIWPADTNPVLGNGGEIGA